MNPHFLAHRRARLTAVSAAWSARRGTFAHSAGVILWALSICGFIFAAYELVQVIAINGALAKDARSYYLAGQHLLAGTPIYTFVPINAPVDYRYPPIFAAFAAPFSLLPELFFAWGWRLVCLASLRYIAGSWRAMGLTLLIPWTLSEIVLANVTFPIAAMVIASMRGRPALLPWAIVLKIGPLIALPYIWLRYPGSRRIILLSSAVLAGLCLAQYVLLPGVWLDYLSSLSYQSHSPLSGIEGAMPLSILPTAGADFALRAFLALLCVAVAYKLRSDSLTFAATVLATPTLWPSRLAALVGLNTTRKPQNQSQRIGRARPRGQRDS